MSRSVQSTGTGITGSSESSNRLGVTNVNMLYGMQKPAHLPVPEENQKTFDGGVEFDVVANSFKLMLKEEQVTLYQYDIRFKPALKEDSDKRIKIVDALRHGIEDELGDSHFIYDNMRLFSEVDRKTFELNYNEISITFERNDTPIKLHEKDIKERLQVLQNFLIHLCSEIGVVRHDKKFIDFGDVDNLDVKDHRCPPLLFTRGYRMAVNVTAQFSPIIRKWERNLSVCCDPCNFIFHKNTVLTNIEEIRENDKIAGKKEKFMKAVRSHLIGQHVTCEIYRSKKVFRIDDVDFNNNAETYMVPHGEDNALIALSAYYMHYYNYEVSSSTKILLLHNVNKENEDAEDMMIALPPEACRLTGFPRDIRRDVVACRRISKKCKIDANIRYHLFEDIKKKLAERADALDHFLKVDESFSCKGKLMDLAPIYLAGNQKPISIKEVQGQINRSTLYNMEHAKLEDGEWAIFYDVDKSKKKAEKLAKKMQQEKCAKTGRTKYLGKPVFISVKEHGGRRGKAESWVKAINYAIENHKLNALVFILPKENTNNKYELEKTYGLIKNECCHIHGIVSQCIRMENIDTTHAVSGITRQMFVKRGAIPWKLRFYKCGTLLDINTPTMLVGIDVHHDKKSCKSTIGFCSTWDRDFVKYYNEVAYQPEKEGVIRQNIMKELMMNGLDSFVSHNRRFPTQILIYRDGGADSQMKEMMELEVTGVRSALARAEIERIGATYGVPVPEIEPVFNFIVIQKRVSARFLVHDGKEAHNVPPGTIIDNYVCSAQHWDWYMVPADAPEGCTASATRFVVLVDNMKIARKGPEHVLALEAFTKQLCNTYFNWAGPVRVPSVCKNADKLSQLYGSNILPSLEQGLEGRVNHQLKDQLHFL